MYIPHISYDSNVTPYIHARVHKKIVFFVEIANHGIIHKRAIMKLRYVNFVYTMCGIGEFFRELYIHGVGSWEN